MLLHVSTTSQPQKRSTSGAISQHDLEKNKSSNQGGGVSRRDRALKNKVSLNNKRESSRGARRSEPRHIKKSDNRNKKEKTDNLLNFQYISHRSYQSGQSTCRKRRATFNKEAYVQANCHFVVNYDEDKYRIHCRDPDVIVDWEAIRLIYLPTHETPKCPICLYPPTAAKITKCGHVYCWPCINHYISLNNKSWSRCPICFESIYDRDLKSCISIVKKKFARGGNISMKLMKRAKDSLISYPEDEWKQSKTSQLSVWKGEYLPSLAKVTMAYNQTVMNNILLKEKAELTDFLKKSLQEKDGEEAFIEKALKQIEENIQHYALSDSCNPRSEEGVEEPIDSWHEKDISTFEAHDMMTNYEDVDGGQGDFYYFYQAEDGQNVFINSLNARCLIEEYGSLENAPKKIIGQILDFDSFSMTNELRKRYRYLAHLPISCEFVICELMLRPPILSKQTIHNFMGEFKKRKAQRSKKLEDQKKHDYQADANLNRSAGFRVQSYDDNKILLDLDDQTDFPSCFSTNEKENNQCTGSSTATEECYKGPSFAQMLKTVSSQNDSKWPPHTKGKELSSRDFRECYDVDDLDGDDDVTAPSLKEMFSAAMNTQWTIEKCESQDPGKRKGSAKGKKGKAKGTLLFATGGQRKY